MLKAYAVLRALAEERLATQDYVLVEDGDSIRGMVFVLLAFNQGLAGPGFMGVAVKPNQREQTLAALREVGEKHATPGFTWNNS